MSDRSKSKKKTAKKTSAKKTNTNRTGARKTAATRKKARPKKKATKNSVPISKSAGSVSLDDSLLRTQREKKANMKKPFNLSHDVIAQRAFLIWQAKGCVAGQDEADLRIDEGVEDRHGRPAREAEYVLDSLAFEALDQLLGTGRNSSLHLSRPFASHGVIFRGFTSVSVLWEGRENSESRENQEFPFKSLEYPWGIS